MAYPGPLPSLADDAAQVGVSNVAPPPPANAPMGALTAIPGKIIFSNGPENYDLTKAGPMHMMKYGTGDYRTWYEGNNNAPGASTETMAVYSTSPDGLAWTKQGMITDLRPNSGLWERAEVSPAFIYTEENVWDLWYHGGDPWSPAGTYTGFGDAIGYATSRDQGTSWVKNPGNPVLSVGSAGSWERYAVSSPRLFKLGDGTFRLYYTGQAGDTVGAPGTTALGMATAPTRYGPWTKYAGNPIIPTAQWGYHGGLFLYENYVWHGWYAVDPSPGGLHYFWSPDGITWFDGPNGTVYAASGNPNDPDSLVGDVVQGFKDGNRNYVSFGGFSANLNGSLGRWEGYMMAYIDGTPTGGWKNGVTAVGVPTDGLVITSVNNFTQKSGGGFRQGSYWLVPHAPNVAVSIKVTAAMAANNDGAALYFALANPGTATVSGYNLDGFLSAGVTTWTINRYDAGVGTILGATFTQTLAVGDTIMFARSGADVQVWYLASGGTWAANGTLLATRNDSTYRRTGYAGVEVMGSQNFKFRAFSIASSTPAVLPADVPLVYLRKNR